MSIHPDSSVYQSLGALYYNTGKIQQSIEIFRKAVEIDPNNVEAVCKYVSFGSELGNNREYLISLQFCGLYAFAQIVTH